MKVLSLRQPWAHMVVHQGKNIENRKWNTCFRGEFLIHAAKGMTLAEYGDAVAFAANAVPSFVRRPIPELRRGGIIGAATLVDVIPPCGAACTCGYRWHMPAQFGFVLANVRALPFEPSSGSLGFFDHDRAAARQP